MLIKYLWKRVKCYTKVNLIKITIEVIVNKFNLLCKLITFSNPNKAFFSNMKCTLTTDTNLKQYISYGKPGFNQIFKDSCRTINCLDTDLVCHKI